MVLQYGLWDQVRVDKGTEGVLMFHVRGNLAEHRHCIIKPPYLATTLKKIRWYKHFPYTLLPLILYRVALPRALSAHLQLPATRVVEVISLH